MSNMFANCKSLAVLNLSNFDTKNIENMKDMFSKCYSLTYLNLSNFKSNKLFEIYVFRLLFFIFIRHIKY